MIADHMRTLFLPPTYQDSAESGRLILRDGSTAFIRLAEPGRGCPVHHGVAFGCPERGGRLGSGRDYDLGRSIS
jgi:hypothetical protein